MTIKTESFLQKSSREMKSKVKSKKKKTFNENLDYQAKRQQRISFKNFLNDQDNKFYDPDDDIE